MGELARWSVQVSREVDESLRSYLAEHGGRKGDLSKFIERAVRKELFRATVRTIQDRSADVPDDQLQVQIDQACAETRAAFWKDRTGWND